MLGGGARTVLHDYANFLNMISNNGIFRGKIILSESSVAEMQRDQVGIARLAANEFVERVRAARHHGVY